MDKNVRDMDVKALEMKSAIPFVCRDCQKDYCPGCNYFNKRKKAIQKLRRL